MLLLYYHCRDSVSTDMMTMVSFTNEHLNEPIRANALEREIRDKLTSMNAAFEAFRAEDQKWKKNTTEFLLALQPSAFSTLPNG